MATNPTHTTDDAQVMDAQAIDAWISGDFSRSRLLFEKSLSIWKSLGNTAEVVYALMHITQAMRFEPGYDPLAARPLLEEALQYALQIGTNRYIAPVKFNLVWLEIDSGEFATALKTMQQLLKTWVDFGDLDGTCHVLEMIAKSAIGLSKHEVGLRLYAAATAIREQRGTEHTNMAYLEYESQALSPARNYLGRAHSEAAEAEGRKLSFDQAVSVAQSITN